MENFKDFKTNKYDLLPKVKEQLDSDDLQIDLPLLDILLTDIASHSNTLSKTTNNFLKMYLRSSFRNSSLKSTLFYNSICHIGLTLESYNDGTDLLLNRGLMYAYSKNYPYAYFEGVNDYLLFDTTTEKYLPQMQKLYLNKQKQQCPVCLRSSFGRSKEIFVGKNRMTGELALFHKKCAVAELSKERCHDFNNFKELVDVVVYQDNLKSICKEMQNIINKEIHHFTDQEIVATIKENMHLDLTEKQLDWFKKTFARNMLGATCYHFKTRQQFHDLVTIAKGAIINTDRDSLPLLNKLSSENKLTLSPITATRLITAINEFC